MLVIDLRKPAAERARFRVYSFILIVGALGAVFGMGVDSVTSQLSAEYFIFGKGLAAGSSFTGEVLALGAKAGFSGALLVGCLFSYFNPDKRNVARLYRYLIWPVTFSLAFGAVLGIWQYTSNAVTLEQIAFLPPEQARMFTSVWMVHAGIYCGALISLPIACYKIGH